MVLTHGQQRCLVPASQFLCPQTCPVSRCILETASRRRCWSQQRLPSFHCPQRNTRLCGCRAKLGMLWSTGHIYIAHKPSVCTVPKPSVCYSAGRQDSGAAPDLRENTNQQQQQQNQQSARQIMLSPSVAKILYKRSLKSLASLPLAIGELFLLAGLSAIGTIIEQNKPLQFYQSAYPDGPNKVLGFLTYNWIFALQWDHIYTSNYFLGLMALLGASLAACTSTRQLPMVKVARR